MGDEKSHGQKGLVPISLFQSSKESLEKEKKETARLREKVKGLETELEIAKKTIEELRNQSRETLLNLLPEIEGFEFLKTVIDLGEPKYEVPESKDIPPEKKWSAVAYKKAHPRLITPEIIALYLKQNWMNHRITRGVLKDKMTDLYRYAELHNVLNMIPTEEQLNQLICLRKSTGNDQEATTAELAKGTARPK